MFFPSLSLCCGCVFSSLQCPTTLVPYFGDQFFWAIYLFFFFSSLLCVCVLLPAVPNNNCPILR